jgi:DNA repair exonuclease SbcCD ATPase subunit
MVIIKVIEDTDLMLKINQFLDKKEEIDIGNNPEYNIKQSMGMLMKQIDKQKMKIIGLNNRIKNSDGANKFISNTRKIAIGTQTSETIYSEDQIIIIYDKLNETKKKLHELKELQKRSTNTNNELKGELEDLKILKNKYFDEVQEKTKTISELEIIQMKFINSEKEQRNTHKQIKQIMEQKQNLENELKEKTEKIKELTDINNTFQETLFNQNPEDIDQGTQ